VDEYQDINPAQEELIRILAKLPVHLCVVADDDQSIYQWRGSDVSNMLTFADRYSGVTPLTLSVNRRSRPTIIKTANEFAKTIKPRLSKAMKEYRKPGTLELHSWAAGTDEEEADVIAATIERLHKQGYRYKDIAILYRSVRTSSPPLLKILKKKGIPFRCAGRTGLFLQPEAQVLGKTYAWLAGRDWKEERYGQSNPVDSDDLLSEYRKVWTVPIILLSSTARQYLGRVGKVDQHARRGHSEAESRYVG
jgi:DNA helicase-2/ATP-dependent DNA helicase PcrA